jgi:hypothetical protein
MFKPTQISAVVTPRDSGHTSIQDSDVNAAANALCVDEKPAKARKMPFAYNPGPTSVILLKIMVMENYSSNAGRLARQRQFCSRVKGA